MRHFAEDGYQGAKVEDVASELGIAKGSIFQHFGSKAGLFFEAYKRRSRRSRPGSTRRRTCWTKGSSRRSCTGSSAPST